MACEQNDGFETVSCHSRHEPQPSLTDNRRKSTQAGTVTEMFGFDVIGYRGSVVLSIDPLAPV